jgi:hypothetical protein
VGELAPFEEHASGKLTANPTLQARASPRARARQ